MYIKKWEMENPEMTDESFAAMYGLNNQRTNGITGLNGFNPYQGQYQYNGANPYSTGYNGG